MSRDQTVNGKSSGSGEPDAKSRNHVGRGGSCEIFCGAAAAALSGQSIALTK